MQLDLSIKQEQKISQSMIQQVTILQMSTQQLTEYMNDMALENPLVDLEEIELERKEKERLRKLEWLESNDEQNRHYYSQDNEDSDEKDFLNIARPEEETLADALKNQLIGKRYSRVQMRIMTYIIDSLDTYGYFREDIEDTSKHLHVKLEQVSACLGILKKLEPAGVCAASLQECLLLQLDRKSGDYEIEKQVVREYIELIGKNQLHVIAREMKLPVERVVQAKECIQALNPKPSSGYSNQETARYVTPDVVVMRMGSGFKVYINDAAYPALRVNRGYMDLLKGADQDKEIRHYLSEKVRQIEQVQSCISKRNSTLRELSEFLAEWQMPFFRSGKGCLQPLRMQDAAKALNLNESTISRAVKDKYLQCSWGIFPMDYFFSKGVADSDTGEMIATEQIKLALKQIIDEENKSKPLSDQKLTSELEKKGFAISRRTVAKYRESMGVADCRGRKKF